MIQVDLTRARLYVHVRIVVVSSRRTTCTAIIVVAAPLMSTTTAVATTRSIAGSIPGHQRELQLQGTGLFRRHFSQAGRVLLGLVHLKIELGAKDAGELLVDALAVVADKVLPVEVVAEGGVVLVELI